MTDPNDPNHSRRTPVTSPASVVAAGRADAAAALPDDGAVFEPGRAERWLSYDHGVRQAFVTLVVIVLTSETLEPRGLSGVGLLAVILQVLNCLLMATRVLPKSIAQRLPPIPLYVTTALAAAALMGVDRSSATSMFAFFVAGLVGFRCVAGTAFALAALTSTACTIAVAAGNAAGQVDTPWYLGALTGASVFIGIANRSRATALDAAREAAQQAERAARSEARAMAMAERARIARDVHDVLAHSLAGINLQLEVVDALLESGDGEKAREAAHRAQSLVREGLAEVSRTVHAMREDALPLVDTLTSLVSGGAPAGTKLEVIGPERELATPKATAIARCAQESMTNARKYAPGAPLRIALTFADDATELDVVNGPAAGERPLAGSGSGMGLVGMQERVAMVGGTVQTGPVVEGADAGGWQVHVVIPA